MAAIAQSLSKEAQLDELTRLNAYDLVTAFKLDQVGPLRGLIDWLARIPARRFARQIMRFDAIVESQSLAAASRYLITEFSRSIQVTGQEHIPRTGPLLIVANHPGLVDVMSVWLALEPRPDLRVIAAERPLLRTIPNTARYLLFVAEQTGSRTGLLRQATGHLRAGGALLTFPAGQIEPDPTIRPGASESLMNWSNSVALFARLAPEALVLPIAVGGVISATALRNPFIRLFRTQKEREWAAATLQVLIPAYRDTHTRVAIGPPVPASTLLALDDSALVTRAIAERMLPLLTSVSGKAVLD